MSDDNREAEETRRLLAGLPEKDRAAYEQEVRASTRMTYLEQAKGAAILHLLVAKGVTTIEEASATIEAMAKVQQDAAIDYMMGRCSERDVAVRIFEQTAGPLPALKETT